MTLGFVASSLTESNADVLLNQIRGKTQREVEAFASTFRPPVKLRDRLRREEAAAKPAIPTPGSAPPLRLAGRQSHCEPFRERIQGSLDRGLLCAQLNQLEADRILGRDMMDGYRRLAHAAQRPG